MGLMGFMGLMGLMGLMDLMGLMGLLFHYQFADDVGVFACDLYKVGS